MCGIFGIYGHKDAVRLTYLGLFALQHRGQESAGIVASDGKNIKAHKAMGLVADVFTPEILDRLSSRAFRLGLAIGHVRYSTTGSSVLKNTQPFGVKYKGGYIAVAHNGNLVNAGSLRNTLEKSGSIFQTTMDSEIIVHLLSKSKEKKFAKALVCALSKLRGAYSLVLMTENQVIAARDPQGFRPLCLGKLDGAYVVASETCALDLIQAKYVRDIEPGEILFIGKTGLHSIKPFPKKKHAFCIFEFIYFARPDSNIYGKNVYLTRQRLGRNLAKEHPVDCDMIMPIPDSGTYAALGFAKESKIPFEMGIIRNHYIGRTFIQPSQYIRDFGVKVKLNPVRELIKDKQIAVIEDSIVRGTTSRVRMRTLREAGAKKIHMRVSCPPHRSPCYYGIDFPTKKELIANRKNINQIRKFIGLDSLAYLSLDGMYKAMFLPRSEFCDACFTGKYCVEPERGINKYRLER